MKKIKFSYIIMLALSSVMFIQCTSEPVVGPAGANGTNGIDGVDGTNGQDGSAAVCISCHSSEHRDPIRAQYALSIHGTSVVQHDGRLTSQYSNRQGCAACHTNQGFIDRFMDGTMDVGPYPTTSNQNISCTGCHDDTSGHRSFDFANDGNDYALRTIAPVTLIVDTDVTIDIKNASDLLGRSNTCINCHQPRTAAPTLADAVDGKFMITSKYWGPHHGPQATMLEGIQGANIVGNLAYPSPGTFPHRTLSSCVKCHMSQGTDNTNGGHTWNPTRTACATCHPDSDFADATTFDRLDFQTETLARMDEIATILVTVVGQDIAKDANGVYQPVFEADGTTPVTHIGILDDTGHAVPGLYDIKYALAAWNHIFLREDKSEGVHNPAYVDALLPNTIQSLQ